MLRTTRRSPPRSIPLGAPLIEIRCHAEVEGRTKDSVGEGNCRQLTWLKRGADSMGLKFVQEVPQPMQRISDNQEERETHAQQAYHSEHSDDGRLHPPRLHRSVVGRKSQVKRSNHDEEHRV